MSQGIVLLDLDGTLLDTGGRRFKQMKDGVVDTNVSAIDFPLLSRAFLRRLRELDYNIYIISDSHPRYVNSIYASFLAPYCDGVLSLADKPNARKTIQFLKEKGVYPLDSQRAYMIGDTWLDICLGRKLKLPTVHIEAFKSEELDERDGVGQPWKQLQAGPTFFVDCLSDIEGILSAPNDHLLAVEAVFRGSNSPRAIKIKVLRDKSQGWYSIFRALARQVQGETDEYSVTNVYFEFSRENRRVETLKHIAMAVSNYLHSVFRSTRFKWDLLTWMPDKKTTVPPDKMSGLMEYIQPDLPVRVGQVFRWREDMSGSIRGISNREGRLKFVSGALQVEPDLDLRGANLIVIDDQYTTGATAEAVERIFREAGGNNLLFLTLFFLTGLVPSDKECPKCGKLLLQKIHRQTGERFYSCSPPRFGGQGCGHREPIYAEPVQYN